MQKAAEVVLIVSLVVSLLGALLNSTIVLADSVDVHCGKYEGVGILVSKTEDGDIRSGIVYSKKDRCIKDLALKTHEIRLCGRIGEVAIRNECYYHLARVYENISVCDSIKKDFDDYLIRNECFISFADTIADLEMCREKVNGENEQDVCFASIFHTDKDISVCPNFHSYRLESTCYANIAFIEENKGICDMMEKNITEKRCKGKDRCEISEQLNDDARKCREKVETKVNFNRCTAGNKVMVKQIIVNDVIGAIERMAKSAYYFKDGEKVEIFVGGFDEKLNTTSIVINKYTLANVRLGELREAGNFSVMFYDTLDDKKGRVVSKYVKLCLAKKEYKQEEKQKERKQISAGKPIEAINKTIREPETVNAKLKKESVFSSIIEVIKGLFK